MLKQETFHRLFFCLAFLPLTSCSTEFLVPNDTRFGSDYFPLQVGQYRIFDVEKIVYSIINPPDTSYFQLKEVIAGSYTNQHEEITYRLERFSRLSETAQWQLDSVWTTSKNGLRAIVTENNVPIVKLVFPLSAEQPWDANALNSRSEEMFTLIQADENLINEINSPLVSLLNEEIVVARHTSQDTVLNNINYLETYVKNIGLFYKKSVRLQYCDREECIGQGVIEAGSYYKQTLISYGQE